MTTANKEGNEKQAEFSLCGMQKGMATPMKSWAVSNQILHLLHLSITAISLLLTLKNETYAHRETSTQRAAALDFGASEAGEKSPALPNPYGQTVTNTQKQQSQLGNTDHERITRTCHQKKILSQTLH